jgi:pimeloyl-ACP methyl ester carboxylesterase
MLTVSNGSVKIHYRVAGSPSAGAVALLIHGLNANMAFWHPGLVSSLGTARALLMYDQRGHGYSDMPPSGYPSADLAGDALALLTAQGIESADVVAHSFGATVALQLARLCPERVRTLVILDGQVRLLQPQTRLREWVHFPKWERCFSAAGIHLDPDLDLDFMLPLRFEEMDMSKVNRALAQDGFFTVSTGKRGAAKYRRLMMETSAPRDLRDDAGLTLESLRGMRQPTLAVYGAFSPFMIAGEGLGRTIPGCQLETIPEVGHNFPFLRPDETAEMTRRLWAACR